MKRTHEQRIIQRVIDELAEGRQAGAADLLGVTQAAVSRYLSGGIAIGRSVVLLAELLLVTCQDPGPCPNCGGRKYGGPWWGDCKTCGPEVTS